MVKLWYHHEHRLGSTDFLTDNIAGKVTSYIDYDEWGEPVKKAILKMGQRELDLVTEYTVHPYDAVLGVYYARARMLDTGDKRFMAVDPVKGNVLEPLSLVQYTYCLDNPIRWIDPSGRSARTAKLANDLIELLVDMGGVGTFDTIKVNSLVDEARKAGVEYAEANNYPTVTEKNWLGITKEVIVTWDNEADALRHFTWNFNMAKQISLEAAIFAGHNHEIMELIRIDVIEAVDLQQSLILAYFNLSTLMDLWNNSVGYNMASMSMHSSKAANEAFKCALSNGWLITNKDEVYDKYGFDASYLASTQNENVVALWNVIDNKIHLTAPGKKTVTVDFNKTVPVNLPNSTNKHMPNYTNE